MNSSFDNFDILVGKPQLWQMGGFGPLYLQVGGLSGFIGYAPDTASDAVQREKLQQVHADSK